MKKRRWIAGLLCAACISTSAVTGNVQAEVVTETTIGGNVYDYQDYQYSYTEDGSGIVIEKYNGTAENVEVPSKINGKQVTTIGLAFYGNTTIKSVRLPEGITTIPMHAFYGCKKLEKIQVPSTVTEIGMHAFHQTLWMKNQRKKNPLVIVNGIVVDGKQCKGNITIPKGVTKISAELSGGLKTWKA